MSDQPSGSWRKKILEALLLIMAVSFTVHIAAGLLAPITPAIIVLIAVIAVLTFIIGRRRH